jgi:hypothetical protein|tara:strand:+ start:59 stop:496 length:438 start_codon:yes stop_codon:yes gene_type:complete
MTDKNIEIIRASWRKHSSDLRKIREIVFMKEQLVPKEEEWDGQDEGSWHYLALSKGNIPVGCARLMPSGQIGRMAVLKELRGLGIGALLLDCAVTHARELKIETIFLHAQTYAIGFYEKAGFKAHGEEFMDANIPHYAMTLISNN